MSHEHEHEHLVHLVVDLGSEVRYVQFARLAEAQAAGRLLRDVGFARSVRVLLDGQAQVW